jgi:isopentenyl-diphosphate Delta-isomerase
MDMSGEDRIALVNDKNEIIGYEKKSIVHQKGLLHKGFSILIFNSKKELLIQKRAISKYHSGGLWSNTCCSHPRKDEDILEACHNRLRNEMGFDCFLKEKFTFIYKTEFVNGLTEHELDHVFFGKYDGIVKLNQHEAMDYKWLNLEDLKRGLNNNPHKYSYWLKLIIDDHFQ